MRNTKVLTLSIPPEMANEVEAVAKAENRTRSELLREAFRQYIENKKWRELQKEAALRAQTGVFYLVICLKSNWLIDWCFFEYIV